MGFYFSFFLSLFATSSAFFMAPGSRSFVTAIHSDLTGKTVPELKDLLKSKGLKVSGKKADLIARLEGSSTSLNSFTRGLLFDCDGVIIETESIHLQAYNEAWKRNGLVNPVTNEPVFWSVEYYDMLQNKVGGGKNKMRYFYDETSSGVWPKSNGGAPPETDEEKQALLDKLQDEKTVIYQELVRTEAVARPGLLELMDEALNDPNIAVGICSASTKSAVETVLDCALGQERVAKLNVFLAGDDVSEKKPNPLIYSTACEKVELDPSQCVVVEDSLIGCKAAKAAGCNCIITYTDSTVQEDFYGEGASAVVEDLSNFGGIKLADVLVEDGVEIMKGKKEGMDRLNKAGSTAPPADAAPEDDETKLRKLLMSL
eukprot:CAMPEP_0118666642 /NCGR_PEP_ID=MMETSP0785-20121206/19330_1 /TAXON_ID=91992 /ORGANISM="Bolidomonas pacifica, Strain CCMP 1866" /LENGTH=371 /DNA_ID=CAMNT_0006560979 /DNA_START=10 /DNA_END=1125 /DNA_ORIENTATION=+